MAILDVPYSSQWTLSSQASVNDCGAACIHMALEYLANTDVAIDSMTAWIGTHGVVSFPRLAQACEHYGIAVDRQRFWTIEALKAAIDERKPVICCVQYGKIPPQNKQDRVFTGGHFVLVIGYQDGQIVYHDPNFKGDREQEGAYQRTTEGLFMRAWNTPPGIASGCSALVPRIGKQEAAPEPVPADGSNLFNIIAEVLEMDKAQSIETLALGYIFADMAMRAAKGERYKFFREADGAIFVNARRETPGAIPVPTMDVLYMIGGTNGGWTQF